MLAARVVSARIHHTESAEPASPRTPEFRKRFFVAFLAEQCSRQSVATVSYTHLDVYKRQMHDDLIDAVDWAVKQGVTTKDQVAIMGGSYGGYATLVGLTFTPETFKCGVDIVGPSNLNTLLATIPPY